MSTRDKIKNALKHVRVPATLVRFEIPGGKMVTVAMVITEAADGDIHTADRQPDHAEMKQAVEVLHHWAGMIEVC